jgi:2-polyprenyl-3-methyl-5-hydroxy-6-metoxy-1,4-benzoquinol methylase
VRDDELTAAIRDVRERLRARHPEGALSGNGIPAADLMPLLHARDAAEAKVAAIGTVNPRAPGLKNSIIQRVKKTIARALDWHVREQVEFNRALMRCVQASLEALEDANRSLAGLAARMMAQEAQTSALHQQLRDEMALLHREAQEMRDLRTHWAEWRAGFEERRSAAEIHMLRTISELQGSFQHRVTVIDQNFRESLRQQHGEFTAALDRNTIEVQQRLWNDLQRIRAEYEKLIHTELRLIRQRTPAERVVEHAPIAAPAARIAIDWMRFAENFRGSEERIREHQRKYVARFAGSVGEILDVGCGRGEFLQVAREAGLAARGIDQSEECIALCRLKGLDAARADMFEYLSALPDASLGGVYCSQVVEHLDPARLPDLVRLIARKVRGGALVAIETPNPECLAIFATHFYLDPTHTRPVPAALLRFCLEEAGFGGVEVERLAPAVDSMPALAELPAAVRDAFFGGLDYAIFARKL